MAAATKEFIAGLPKCELHIHIEGTLEPELMQTLAKRNNLTLDYSAEEIHKQRANFKDLQDFLDLYYSACEVLLQEQDFYDLMYAYLTKASQDNVRYAEIFFDPQTHTDRGVAIGHVVNGLYRATVDAKEKLGVEAKLILCFLRHLSQEKAFETIKSAEKYVAEGKIIGEAGNPPSKFENVFKYAVGLGLTPVAHAGEEGPPEYITEALDLLKVVRIDHGVRCLEDDAVVARLVKEQVPLTVCPCSNARLKVDERYFKGQSAVRQLLDRGIKVTLNSDDPAYFGGYMDTNFNNVRQDCDLTRDELEKICINSFEATTLTEEEKVKYIEEVRNYCNSQQVPQASRICTCL